MNQFEAKVWTVLMGFGRRCVVRCVWVAIVVVGDFPWPRLPPVKFLGS